MHRGVIPYDGFILAVPGPMWTLVKSTDMALMTFVSLGKLFTLLQSLPSL